jgi:hypothetical protein
MAINYGLIAKAVSSVMKAVGGDVTIRYVTPGTYNTTTGEINESVSDTVVKGVLEDVNLAEVNGLVQAGDKRLTIAADDVTTAPETKDKVVISSVVHQVIAVESNEQDATAMSYVLTLRA